MGRQRLGGKAISISDVVTVVEVGGDVAAFVKYNVEVVAKYHNFQHDQYIQQAAGQFTFCPTCITMSGC